MTRTSLTTTLMIGAALLAAGCSTSSNSNGGQPDASGNEAGSTAMLSFIPSNIPASVLAGGAPGAMIFDGAHCGGESNAIIDTDKGTTDCDSVAAGSAFRFVLAQQADGSDVAVFVTQSLRIAVALTVTVTGKTPLVIVALDTAQVLGTLSAAATSLEGIGGGFSARVNMAGAGNGPGAGKLMMEGGGGGGSYCGRGGKGGSGNLGGATYGSPTITPLLGGSSGANAGIYEAGGGGGAIQLVAGSSIQIGTTGVITVGGAGGSQAGSGGGSGGSILLEAPVVKVMGVLAANGGGGGSGTGTAHGVNGGADDAPAKGGTDGTLNANGGDGAAGAFSDGTDGKPNSDFSSGIYSGGGGGGAGYIRINSAAGTATVTGKLSPAGATCASQGTLG